MTHIRPVACLVNTMLSEHSHIHPFVCCLWVFSRYLTEFNGCNEAVHPAKQEVFTSWAFRAELGLGRGEEGTCAAKCKEALALGVRQVLTPGTWCLALPIAKQFLDSEINDESDIPGLELHGPQG